LRGEYASAAAGYARLAVGEQAAECRGRQAQALSAAGRYDDALKALAECPDAGAKNARWQLARAEALAATGRYEEALSAATAANELKPAWGPTILARGMLLETLGRKDQARDVYKTMELAVAGDDWRTDAESLTALGGVLDRFSILTGRKASEQAANILHNYLQEAYQKASSGYWPANVAAGQFLLGKHNFKEAAEEFELALKANPRCGDAHVGLAAIALENWQFEACLQHVAAALAANPHHVAALTTKAACLMQWRKLDQAPAALDAALKVNPNSVEALSLYAALCALNRDEAAAAQYAQRVAAVDAGSAVLPDTVGDWLASRRQWAAAAEQFRKAMELAPEWAEPVTNLAVLYMDMGEEDQARELLEKASAIDDFRVDVRNFRKLLGQMQSFAAKETAHFIVKVDPRYDAILLDQVCEYMESIYPQVCRELQHEPAAKTIIEIFPSHAQFSVRITGKAWIGTVGAATGRVIALVAPNHQRSEFGTFNWGTVLRHEFTHTVTQDATDYRIPHWFTEACAVWQQPDKMNYDAILTLVDAVRMGRLFPIRELDWGFWRPRRNADRGLAYAQAEWVMEYIIATQRYDKIIEMLKACKDGMTQAQMFQKVLGVSEADFDKAFAAWAAEQVRQWGYDPTPLLPPDKAMAHAQANPQDAAAQAGAAATMLAAGQPPQAEALARKALELDGGNVRAREVLATALMRQRKWDDASAAATALGELDAASRVAPRVLAACHEARQNWPAAVKSLELLKTRAPLEPYSYQRLAEIYTQLGQPSQALPNLIELHNRSLMDPQWARRIADIYRSSQQPERALAYYQAITQINPYEVSAYQAMAAIHRNAHRYEQAVAAAERMCMLSPDSPEALCSLAALQYLWAKETKDRARMQSARATAEKALKIDSQCQGREIIEQIDAAEAMLPPAPATAPASSPHNAPLDSPA
jgi:tetratricopeptide (TPR) repeat protein